MSEQFFLIIPGPSEPFWKRKESRGNRRNEQASYDSLIAVEGRQDLEDEQGNRQGFFMPEAKDSPKVRRG